MEGSMSEDKQQAVTETVSESPATETTQNSSNEQYIAESKKYRKRAQDAETKLAEYEDNFKKAKESKMIEEGKKDEVIANLIAERDKFKTSHERLTVYEEKRMATMLEKHPEEDREQLSKLDLETLEYVTNKITTTKANAPEVAGNPRKDYKTPPKDWTTLPADELRDSWDDIVADAVAKGKAKVKQLKT